MGPKMKPRQVFKLLGVLFIVVILHWLIFQGHEIVPSVITRPLGPCDVDWFGNKHGTIAIACPRTDYIKIWPLPFEYPWFEDTLFPNEKTVTLFLLPT
jgi:hypothetical protein